MRIARDALPSASLLGVASVVLALLIHPVAALPPALLLALTLWFFRDPERHPPDDPAALLSPADGRVVKAGPDAISVFMNIFNVHVCRSPAGGVVGRVEHTPGRFLAAYRDEATEHNERLSIELVDEEIRLRFTLVAGLVARRIVCSVKPGDRLRAGQRIGLIRFGSRVDLELPRGGEIAVSLNQRVVAGETVLARIPGPAFDGAVSAGAPRPGSGPGHGSDEGRSESPERRPPSRRR
jgi:phosphatidylserine decarboxylase